MPGSTDMLSKEDIKSLCKEFPGPTLGVKVQSLSKSRDKAMLVIYLQHNDVATRIEEVDTAWSAQILSQTQEKLEHETLYIVTMRLNIKSVVRDNVGEGNSPKAAVSDAFKRCAMSFGVGRYLYDQGTKWVPYNESADKYRTWTVDDFYGKQPPKTPPQTQTSPTPARGYIIPFGKYKGTQLMDIPDDTLKKYYDWVLGEADKKGETKESMSDMMRGFLENVEKYLGC